MDKKFADWYRVASLEPKDEPLEQRWSGIIAAVDELDNEKLVELYLIYRNEVLVPSEFLDEFKSYFKDNDDTFPMEGNDMELRVLSGASLLTLIKKENKSEEYRDLAILASMFIEFDEFLSPGKGLIPESVLTASNFLRNSSRSLRKVSFPKIDDNNEKIKNKLNEVANHSQIPQFKEAVGFINDVIESYGKSFESFEEFSSYKQEESEILWWLFGEHSNGMECHFSDLGNSAPLVFGIELFELTVGNTAPISTVAFLRKALRLSKHEKVKLTFRKVLESCDKDWISNLDTEIDDDGKKVLPLLFCLETYRNEATRISFAEITKKTNGFDPDKEYDAITLAYEIYLEMLASWGIANT